MLDLGAWWFAVTTPVGTAAAIRVAGLVLLQHALRARPVRIGRPVVFVRGGVSFVGGLVIAPDAVRRAGAAASASLLVSSFVLVGHAQASEPRWLLVLCDLVHVIAGSVWLGGVVLLVLELRRRGGSRAVAATAVSVDRFSKAAAAAVVTMFATGTVLAWGQLHTVDRLFSTSYGITLLCKLAFVLVVVGLGGYNHHVLVPGVARGDSERAWQRLRRTVTIEAVVLLAGVIPMTVAMSTGGLRNLA
jgi:copper transport protein